MEQAVERLEARVNEAIHRGRDVYVNELNNLADRVHTMEGNTAYTKYTIYYTLYRCIHTWLQQYTCIRDYIIYIRVFVIRSSTSNELEC